MAVRVVQRAFESVFAGGLGELRTYNGSRFLKLITGSGLSIYIEEEAHIKVAKDLYHEIEGDGKKVDHGVHKGG